MREEVWDDGTWFEGWRESDDRPLPPGVYVPVGPGVHSEVTLPDGTVHQITPVVMSSAGSIFVPLVVS